MKKLKDKLLSNIKSLVICFIALISVSALTGCGVSDENKEKMYNAVIADGELNLSADFSQYEEIRRVDGSPVPVVSTYYIYRGDNGEKYTFEFHYAGSEEYDSTYWAKVLVETGSVDKMSDTAPPETSMSYVYRFHRYRISKRMKVSERNLNSYMRRFPDDAQYGVRSVTLYNGELKIYFDSDNIDERIKKQLLSYEDKEENDTDIVIGTAKGECKAERVIMAKALEGRDCELKAEIECRDIPLWIQFGDIWIDTGF